MSEDELDGSAAARLEVDEQQPAARPEHVALVCFFFSSRRRHTIFDCDWSSDVCSSDLHAIIPSDAFTAETLGTERAGNGVLIRENGVVLTIGYLITEAETVWLHLNDGRVVPGHVLGYDQATGFGLVQALAKLDLPALPF